MEQPITPARMTAAAAGPRPAPAPWRDPWAWASVLAVLPLLLRSLGAPLGEAVAEDFDFLNRSLLQGMGTLLDGGASQAFWRPIPHQLYYAALGRLIVGHPGAVAALHVLLLALGALLLYRALRPSWSGPMAAAAAAFPLLAESTRTLVSWPSQFVDVGLFLFSALALHEAARRRLPTSLAALLAALLCKELAVVTAAFLPLLPLPVLHRRRVRLRWALAAGLVVAAWAAAYLWVRHTAGLSLPHHLETDPALLATPLAARFAWALRGSARAIMSLDLVAGPRDTWAAVAVLAVLVLAAGFAFGSRAARARLRRTAPWSLWGLGWFLAASAVLGTIFPIWQPNRSQFGSVGLGIAAVALLSAARPWLVAALLAARLALLALAPGPARTVSTEPPATGAFMDFPHLSRLQRLMREVRLALRGRYPALPGGSRVVQHNLPHAAEYAFGGDRALRVWYRDPTLRWVRFDAFRADPGMEAAAIVEFQPGRAREIALVEPAAMRAQLDGYRRLSSGDWNGAVTALDRAEALQRDTLAVVFRAYAASRRALCLGQLGQLERAEEQARAALALDPADPNNRFILATVLAQARRDQAALAELDSVLVTTPDDRDAQALRAAVTARAGAR
jgi:tetratricopeptide (TPR) repeat protein